jgi:hypothetical protein
MLPITNEKKIRLEKKAIRESFTATYTAPYDRDPLRSANRYLVDVT